ncbi:hypothetical protein NE237_028571 [Protea cynaroides]|uniref:Uncharacterized protein n=1 Tax=Protea cynaroides TaxID=273540 RepID=A0A9Q0JSZ5_9MAGN|nr:hypothetical protein NE237_028571 [Protea cynaroides]
MALLRQMFGPSAEKVFRIDMLFRRSSKKWLRIDQLIQKGRRVQSICGEIYEYLFIKDFLSRENSQSIQDFQTQMVDEANKANIIFTLCHCQVLLDISQL